MKFIQTAKVLVFYCINEMLLSVKMSMMFIDMVKGE